MTSAIQQLRHSETRPESQINQSQKVLLGLAAAALIGAVITLPFGLKGRMSLVPAGVLGGLTIAFGVTSYCCRPRTPGITPQPIPAPQPGQVAAPAPSSTPAPADHPKPFGARTVTELLTKVGRDRRQVEQWMSYHPENHPPLPRSEQEEQALREVRAIVSPPRSEWENLLDRIGFCLRNQQAVYVKTADSQAYHQVVKVQDQTIHSHRAVFTNEAPAELMIFRKPVTFETNPTVFLTLPTPQNMPPTIAEALRVAQICRCQTRIIYFVPEGGDSHYLEKVGQMLVDTSWLAVCNAIDEALKSDQMVYGRHHNGRVLHVTATGKDSLQTGWGIGDVTIDRDRPVTLLIVDQHLPKADGEG